MARILKRQTAETIWVGPFVTVNGDAITTLATSGYLDQGAWQIVKEGGAGFATKNDSSGGTHRGNGMYSTTLNATDTNTLGQLIVSVNATGALPLSQSYMVQYQNPYDAFYGSSVLLDVNTDQIADFTAAATNLSAAARTMVLGTVFDDGVTYVNTRTVIFCDDITEATADHFIGSTIKFRSGNLLYQATKIEDYEQVSTFAKFTVTELTEAPANNDTFIIV
jgi:hypothetical protein